MTEKQLKEWATTVSKTGSLDKSIAKAILRLFAKVEREKIYSGLLEDNKEISKALLEAVEELRFYGDRKNWLGDNNDGFMLPIEDDHGTRARTLIKKLEEGK